jgi:hypothetical protein
MHCTSRNSQPKKVRNKKIKNLQQEIKNSELKLANAYLKKLSRRLEIKSNIGSLYRSKSRSFIVGVAYLTKTPISMS